MNKTYYICKYTPIELIRALGGEPCELDYQPDNFAFSEGYIHPNVCGYGKSIIEAVKKYNIKELVLVDCCDTINGVYDVLKEMGSLDFLYMFRIIHNECCGKSNMIENIKDFIKTYGEYKGREFVPEEFCSCFDRVNTTQPGDFIALLGARVGKSTFDLIQNIMPLPVKNLTCVHNRRVLPPENNPSKEDIFSKYADEILGQIPCMRMKDNSGRRALFSTPGLKGIIYHTIKFCDFYGFEYMDISSKMDIPVLKIETDNTTPGGELVTRLEAFSEGLKNSGIGNMENSISKNLPEDSFAGDVKYFVGIDSGSASTDIVIMDSEENIVGDLILPTGAGAVLGAKKAMEIIMENTGVLPSDIKRIITTGYGRESIREKIKDILPDFKGECSSVTEITCHGIGAKYLYPDAASVIDIGGQDSKVIVLDDSGKVTNFIMNDKCAAGTGRFLEMMAGILEMEIEDMAKRGLSYKEDLTISSMCTVFAETEVVSLVAENKDIDSIVHGLNKSIAEKTATLVKRAAASGPFIMTGGVSKNSGVVAALEEALQSEIHVSDKSQLCGAIGAALIDR